MSSVGAYEAEFLRRLQKAVGDTYALEQSLGRGGFAQVFSATDLRLKRRVAIKVLREELMDTPAGRDRFRREAESVAALRHPNVIPIYAVGEGEGLVYFIMPLIEGGSLAQRLARESRLTVPEARRVLREAAAGLGAAHRIGIIHRDVKPDNILLDGPERRVVLTDFGIAKAARGQGALTQTGAVVGTPHYMSPEQASGERAIDARSDLYALGVVAYQVLTGQLPFNAATVAAVLLQHMTEMPQPISVVRSDCPAGLSSVVMRCLAKAPEERWASAEDFVRALDELPVAPTITGPRLRLSGAVAVRTAPARQFRRLLVGSAGALVLGVGLDALLHRVVFGPLAAILGGLVVTAGYGRLWVAGFSWRDLIHRNPLPSDVAATSLDSSELGPHRATIHQARNDRAAMLSALQGLSRTERQRLGDVLPAVDAALARATDGARQLYMVERQLEPGPAGLERRLADTRNEPPSPGREQRVLVLTKRLEAVERLIERQHQLNAKLGERLGAITQLRFALTEVVSHGSVDDLAGLAAAIEHARAIAQDVA